MSLDPSANLQIFSPTGSGRSSPSPRATRNTNEDALYKKDKSFRRYAAGIERALALWDAAQQEWADYISFLGRLLKALQAHPAETPVIPHSDTITLRLAQCLNPALPSGVHQKALEVYAHIFSITGKEGLARDLNLYLPGLAPVLSFASLSVRPLYLSLLEGFILRLDGVALRPALKAIILSLLPGLEDETSEDFERMASALDKLRDAVRSHSDEIADVRSESGSSHFWQCFFLATITNASRRQGALAYLVRRLPRFGIIQRRGSFATEQSVPPETLSAEAEAAISPEPGLLIRCFEAGLSDPQLLIQRGFLDLLVTHLPLDSPVLQQRISNDDLERLVAAAAGVVSRRDMSLNRRLWAWFLGPEPVPGADPADPTASPTQDQKIAGLDTSSHYAAYFSQHGLRALTRCIMKMINRPSTLPSERAKPFRLCLSLMDRWEVGGLIVPEVFLPALQSVQTYSETAASKEELDEVMRSASVFFDGVESGLIWGKLLHLVTSSLNSKFEDQLEGLRRVKLARFVLARFNLKEEEMLLHHMPLMIVATLATINQITEGPSTIRVFEKNTADLAFEITDSLVQFVPDRALWDEHDLGKEMSCTISTPREVVLQKIQSFYGDSHGNLDFSEPPFAAAEVGQLVLREASHMFSASIQPAQRISTSEMSSKILSTVIFKVHRFEALKDANLSESFQRVLSLSRSGSPNSIPFIDLVAISSVLSALQTGSPSAPYIDPPQLSEIMHPLVAAFWHHLDPFIPKSHVEAVRSILQLHAISFSNRTVEAAISSILVREISSSDQFTSTGSSDAGRRFAVLWTHIMHEQSFQTEKRGIPVSQRSSALGILPLTVSSGFQTVLTRPLLILLDSLAEERTELSSFVRTWLQDLPTLNKVFEVLVAHLQSLRCLSSDEGLTPDKIPQSRRSTQSWTDTKDCLYYLKHFLHILERPSPYTWSVLAEELTSQTNEAAEVKATLQVWIVRTCLKSLSIPGNKTDPDGTPHIQSLFQTSASIINQVYQGPFASSLKELELEVPLMARLQTADPTLQSLLLDAILSALRLRIQPAEPHPTDQHATNNGTTRSRLSLVMDRSSVEIEHPPVPPPPQLIDCLKFGFSSPSSRLILDNWVHFLAEVLPLFADAIFQSLLPLVECLCKQINQTFEQLTTIFSGPGPSREASPEPTLISLINGLERILAKAHDRLTIQETKSIANKSPEQPQGFFGNMVSGVFSSEATQARAPTANSRLTVLLCFQDTVRICFSVWAWGGYGAKEIRQDLSSTASFGYTSLRMRNRARRMLESLFAAEALECLETLAVLWAHSTREDTQAIAVMGLLNVLNGSKPKHTIPAIFNAIYSRTNPNALDPNRMSTLTSDLADTDLVAFLVNYTKSLEDDAMDEIWGDCTIFLRDVLANPLPHRQILPTLLEFTAVIGQKVDNTNFGEQRKMRKELADIFTRLLTAVFTTRSMGFLQEPALLAAVEKTSGSTKGGQGQKRVVDVVSILTSIVPHLSTILIENDRVTSVVTNISTSVIGPTFRAKAFPENVSKPILDLLYQITRTAQANKFWKKEIYDAFNDPRFFSTPLPLLKTCWLPILAQWTHSDKDRLPELLSRLSPPTTAGIMFGVGAASARQEADRKAQLTLRRIALLVLAAPEDSFTPNLPQVLEKIVELLTATPASSPSSTTRPDLLILLRSLILKTSAVHLAPVWPILNGELTSAISSLLPDAGNKESYNNSSIIQACKLLDQLVVLSPDDFQLIEWLFITDTIDAVYKPVEWYPRSLTDEVSEILSASETPTSRQRTTLPMAAHPYSSTGTSEDSKRVLFLDPLIEALEKEEDAEVTDMARRELVDRVVRPFLGQLAMVSFESTYGGGKPDWEGCWNSCVRDASGAEQA
ncbi:Dopey, N-terminal-domain-containing protein [Clohesyomyces aquaticus]|uniref:Dopey, N-terminal-domain-containing protein n=1 Tax=Clohesyomyces aquaticus TaxID=1231657 RepID=A0A1Y1YLA6_9PLEO|nr:Dopey, N-terminal-domain-containing protein [Clohesyomyces aquaticus]